MAEDENMPLTKESSRDSCEALFAEQHRRANEEKNARARPVPLYYRFRDLNAFEPWQRAAVVGEARRRAIRKLPVVLGLMLWAILLVAAWLFFAPAEYGLGTPFALLLLGICPQLLALRIITRNEIRKIAKTVAKQHRESPA